MMSNGGLRGLPALGKSVLAIEQGLVTVVSLRAGRLSVIYRLRVRYYSNFCKDRNYCNFYCAFTKLF